MSAFHQALNNGFNFLEFDLLLTSDEQLVVLHDKTLKRTCEVSGPDAKTPVSWLSLDTIRSYNLKGYMESAPSFEEVLGLLEVHPNLVLLPELKAHDPHTTNCFLRKVAEHPHRDRLLVQSFQHAQLRHVLANSDLKICPLYQFRPDSVDELECQWEAPMAECLLLRPSTVERIHQRGRKVAAWFFVTEGWQWMRRRMESLGVDALMVDTY